MLVDSVKLYVGLLVCHVTGLFTVHFDSQRLGARERRSKFVWFEQPIKPSPDFPRFFRPMQLHQTVQPNFRS